MAFTFSFRMESTANDFSKRGKYNLGNVTLFENCLASKINNVTSRNVAPVLICKCNINQIITLNNDKASCFELYIVI